MGLPSKLCGYNEKQQLICKICSTVIKSWTLWKSHSDSTKHQQTLKHLMKLKAERDANKIKEVENEKLFKKSEETKSIQNEEHNEEKTDENKEINDDEDKTE